MSTGKFYQEAISEANDLVRMAEERARDKLIESVMPRIRTLLEKRILEDASDEDKDDDFADDLLFSGDDGDSDDEELEDIDSDEVEGDFEDLSPAPPLAPAPAPVPTSSNDGSIDLTIPKGVKKVSITVQESNKKTSADKIVQLDESNIKDLIKLVDGRGTLVERARSIQLELKSLKGELDALNGRGKQLRAGGRIVEEFNAILRKSIGLKQEIRDMIPGPLAEGAKRELTKIEKEIKEMSTRTLLRSLLAENTAVEGVEESKGVEETDINEAEDEGGDDALVDMGDDSDDTDDDSDDMDTDSDDMDMDSDDMDMDSDEGDVDADKVLRALNDLAAAAGMEVVPKKEESVKEPTEEGYGYMEETPGEDTGPVYEIDESMLRRELGRLRALREAAAKDMAHHFGGGKASVDLFEKPVKLNKSDKSVMPETSESKGRGTDVDEAEDGKVKESRRNRALVAKIQEAAKAIKALDRQLAEQKLFNAKLLYVNKLMQSSSLTDKQFRSIVEALDSAKNLREAHLLYSSLSESLAKPGRALSEGARTAGGSSRPVGTASTSTTLNEGAVVDRWALLAGIKK